MATNKLHKINLDLKKFSKKTGKKEWTQWHNFLKSLCHKNLQRLVRSLGQWTTTIQKSQRLWPFYYSRKTGILCRGYRDEWHNNKKYQFDEHKRNDDDGFAFEPGARNVELEYIPIDAVPVDVAIARHGWLSCHFHTLKPHPAAIVTTPPTDLTHFIKSQPAYIS